MTISAIACAMCCAVGSATDSNSVFLSHILELNHSNIRQRTVISAILPAPTPNKGNAQAGVLVFLAE